MKLLYYEGECIYISRGISLSEYINRPRDSDLYMYADAVKSLNAGLAFSEADRQTVRP